MDRRNWDIAVSEIRKQRDIQESKQLEISETEKLEAAKRYCNIKDVVFEEIVDNEIHAINDVDSKIIYRGSFRRSGDVVLFDMDSSEIIKVEPETKDIPIEEITYFISEFKTIMNEMGIVIAMIAKWSEIEDLGKEIGIDPTVIKDAPTPIESIPISEEMQESPELEPIETNAMPDYTMKYYQDTYKDVENLKVIYKTSIDQAMKIRVEYDLDRRKGGRYRKKRINQLDQRIKNLRSEYREIRAALSESDGMINLNSPPR